MTYLCRNLPSHIYDEFSTREGAYEWAAGASTCHLCNRPLFNLFNGLADRVVIETVGFPYGPGSDIYINVTHGGECVKRLLKVIRQNREEYASA